jgi:hypothetical protein
MATFTFRATPELALHLSSARMRSWLDAFLEQPHALPTDPGPGGERISLTLSPTAVDAVAAHAGCSPSSALRRIAAERLGASERATPSVSLPVNHSQTAGMERTDASSIPKDGAPGVGVLAVWLVHVFFWLLFVLGMFFISRKGKQSSA